MKHIFAKRTFLALAATATLGSAFAAHAGSASTAPANIGATQSHTLTIAVCAPTESDLCKRDRVSVTAGSALQVARATKQPYKAVEERVESKGKVSSRAHFDSYDTGFRVAVTTKSLTASSAVVDYDIEGKGLAAMLDVTADDIRVSSPSTATNHFAGTIELTSGQPTVVVRGMETVTLTLDEK